MAWSSRTRIDIGRVEQEEEVSLVVEFMSKQEEELKHDLQALLVSSSNPLVFHSSSLEETHTLGKALATFLSGEKAPSLCLFKGEFGAGKTTLIKSIISHMGDTPSEAIASPTFQYVALYPTRRGKMVAHFDLWRLESSEQFEHLGLFDILSSSLSLIEWPEKLQELSQKEALVVELESTSEQKRRGTLRIGGRRR